MKKIWNVLLIILLIFAMIGCNGEAVEESEAVQSVTDETSTHEDELEDEGEESSGIDAALLPDSDESKEESSVDENSTDENDFEESSNSESNSSEQSDSQGSSRSSDSASSSKGQSDSTESPQNTDSSQGGSTSTKSHSSSSGNSGNSGGSSNSNSGTSSNDSPSDPNMITVTISIDARTAYAKGHINYEYILGSTKVETEKGSSVWDVLNKVTRSKGIPVVKRGSGNNLYVSHINSIGEFDFGESGSGWMYNVNGTYPNFGCDNSRSVLNDGDVIQWRYTLNLGKDLGASQN